MQKRALARLCKLCALCILHTYAAQSQRTLRARGKTSLDSNTQIKSCGAYRKVPSCMFRFVKAHWGEMIDPKRPFSRAQCVPPLSWLRQPVARSCAAVAQQRARVGRVKLHYSHRLIYPQTVIFGPVEERNIKPWGFLPCSTMLLFRFKTRCKCATLTLTFPK